MQSIQEPSNKDWMWRRCDKCPHQNDLEAYLKDKFEDLSDCTTFKQWTAVDRAELITLEFIVDDFFEMLVEKLIKLTPHSFIAKQQSSYLRCRKENL